MDKRIHYIIMLDTETAGTLQDPFVYDIGWAITDKKGRIYKKRSFIIDEIFNKELELMDTAYYTSKRKKYIKEIAEGKRILTDFYTARAALWADMEEYGTKTVAAHNMPFDYRSTNTTQRWLTKSKYRYFFPYGTEFWDTLRMAQDVVAYTPTYQQFCKENGFVTKHKTPRTQVTAEVLYRFITRDMDFIEDHTALEDAVIEAKILAYCFNKHKPMQKNAWGKSKRKKD